MMKHERSDQAEKTSKLRSLSSKKDSKRSSTKKNAATKKAAAQAESEDAKAQAEDENAAEAEAKRENAGAEAEEVERMCTGSMVNNSVETANEAGGRHRGRPGLHTVNEEVDHIVFHDDHVEHDMNDRTDERTRTMRNITYANGEQIDIVTENEETEAEAEVIESMSTETTLNVAVTAGVTGEEH